MFPKLVRCGFGFMAAGCIEYRLGYMHIASCVLRIYIWAQQVWINHLIIVRMRKWTPKSTKVHRLTKFFYGVPMESFSKVNTGISAGASTTGGANVQSTGGAADTTGGGAVSVGVKG